MELKENDLIENLIVQFPNVTIHSVNDVIVDYVLKCTKGVYKDRFIYINLTQQGEIIGSDISQNLTLLIENMGLESKHCEIKYLNKEQRYILKDLS